MKTKITLAVLVVALAAALVAGTMGAWFTAEDELPVAEFKAGTVAINVDGLEVGGEELSEQPIENVNPGDDFDLCWRIVNTGTKRAQLRVKFEKEWVAGEEGGEDLSPSVVGLSLAKEQWRLEDDGYYYYMDGPLAGTFADADGAEVELCVNVKFDGSSMGNKYQGAQFKLSGKVEAVQASNGAPFEVWGIDLFAEGEVDEG